MSSHNGSSSSPHPSTGKRKHAVMDEVMKLHQDEGIFHLMHGLPNQRKRTQRVFYNASPKPGGPNVAALASALPARVRFDFPHFSTVL